MQATPATQTRNHLTMASLLLQSRSLRDISDVLNRSPRTISWERQRNVAKVANVSTASPYASASYVHLPEIKVNRLFPWNWEGGIAHAYRCSESQEN